MKAASCSWTLLHIQ